LSFQTTALAVGCFELIFLKIYNSNKPLFAFWNQKRIAPRGFEEGRYRQSVRMPLASIYDEKNRSSDFYTVNG
jgi:hypothetical protein